MELINKNIRYLREVAGWTQKELAAKIDVKVPVIGSYEEFRSIPPIPMAVKIADVFNIDLDTLVRKDMGKSDKKRSSISKFKRGNDVVVITVDAFNQENVELVNQKASAGYLNGFSDVEYIKELPKLHLPFLSKNASFRAFEITGDSMLPIPPKSVVIGSYVENLADIKDGETCVVISKEEGVVYKRVFNQLKEGNGLLLVSDNPAYKPYFIHYNDVLEVWRKVRIIVDSVEANTTMSGSEIASLALTIHHELSRKK